MIILFLCIILSIVAGILYALFTKDEAGGISLATYFLACPTLILALYSAGEYIGIDRPASFAWAYDTPSGAYAFETYKVDLEIPL